MHSEYALPLLVEAGLLLCFGLIGGRLTQVNGLFVSATVMLLCFIMGLQNAVITKLSHAEIRTTHITGMVTDIGIELGKLFYRNQLNAPGIVAVRANRFRLRVLMLLVGCFFMGGLLGALGFRYLGYAATVPVAMILMALAMVPVTDDLGIFIKNRKAKRV